MTEYPCIKVFKALGEQNRLKAVLALHKKELCVCQIVELLGLAPSTVSKHLTILKEAGLVSTRKQGRWIYYRLAQGGLPDLPFSLFESVLNSLSKTERAKEDAQRLKYILSPDAVEAEAVS